MNFENLKFPDVSFEIPETGSEETPDENKKANRLSMLCAKNCSH